MVLSLTLIICTSVTTQSYPNSVLASQNVAIFGPKILAVLKVKRRGKFFGGLFFDNLNKNLGPRCTPFRDNKFGLA